MLARRSRSTRGTATINAITISPLSLSVDLMIDFPIEVRRSASTPQSKRLQGLPLTVNMKDGTVVDATQKSGSAVSAEAYDGHRQVLMFDGSSTSTGGVDHGQGVDIPMP